VSDFYYRHIQSPWWYALKDRIKARARGRCEYCRRRPVDNLHHRTYARLGGERDSDVMAVCRPCHRFIDGEWPWRRKLTVNKGSLADLGDDGRGVESQLWRDYVAACERRDWQFWAGGCDRDFVEPQELHDAHVRAWARERGDR
jgi:hypothetical protein